MCAAQVSTSAFAKTQEPPAAGAVRQAARSQALPAAGSTYQAAHSEGHPVAGAPACCATTRAEGPSPMALFMLLPAHEYWLPTCMPCTWFVARHPSNTLKPPHHQLLMCIPASPPRPPASRTPCTASASWRCPDHHSRQPAVPGPARRRCCSPGLQPADHEVTFLSDEVTCSAGHACCCSGSCGLEAKSSVTVLPSRLCG